MIPQINLDKHLRELNKLEEIFLNKNLSCGVRHKAILEIANRKFYRLNYPSFKEYCKQKLKVHPSIIDTIRKSSGKSHISNRLRWEIWERDNFTCQLCGKRRYLSVDHVVSESNGGTLDPSNLQTLCRSCNSKKGSK